MEAETIQMAQAPVGNGNCSNDRQDATQEVEASSRVRKTTRRCKEWCIQLKRFWLWLLGSVLIIVIVTSAVGIRISCNRNSPLEQCPSKWIGYKNRCYFISEEEKNWTASQTSCAENGSSLAVFENQKEMHFLATVLKIDDCWIGLHKKGEKFYWDDGNALKEDLFQIQNHSECAYVDAFTISTSACSLPRRWICIKLP